MTDPLAYGTTLSLARVIEEAVPRRRVKRRL
jgi:hypothetical protein